MINPDPKKRPSASEILQDPFIGEYSKEQLRKELNEEKFKNEVLSRKLDAAEKAASQCNSLFDHRNKRLVGKKVNRSMSLSVIM